MGEPSVLAGDRRALGFGGGRVAGGVGLLVGLLRLLALLLGLLGALLGLLPVLLALLLALFLALFLRALLRGRLHHERRPGAGDDEAVGVEVVGRLVPAVDLVELDAEVEAGIGDRLLLLLGGARRVAVELR